MTPAVREVLRVNDLSGAAGLKGYVGFSALFKRPRGGTKLAFLRSKHRKLRDTGRLGRGKPNRCYVNNDNMTLHLRPKAA